MLNPWTSGGQNTNSAKCQVGNVTWLDLLVEIKRNTNLKIVFVYLFKLWNIRNQWCKIIITGHYLFISVMVPSSDLCGQTYNILTDMPDFSKKNIYSLVIFTFWWTFLLSALISALFLFHFLLCCGIGPGGSENTYKNETDLDTCRVCSGEEENSGWKGKDKAKQTSEPWGNIPSVVVR